MPRLSTAAIGAKNGVSCPSRSAADGSAPLFNEAAAGRGNYAQALQPLLQSLVAAFFLLFLVTGVNVGDYHPKWRPEEPCVMQSFASFNGPMPAGAL